MRDVIVSTTLLGRGTAPVVRAAIRSVVMWVDRVLVIDTGADEADVEEAATAASSKLVLRRWPWQDDFAAARNEALRLAGLEGATWALTLDTDERVTCHDTRVLRAELAAARVDCLQARHAGAGYAKPRLIRVPCRGAWRGPNHEGLYGVSCATTAAVTFHEERRAPGHLDTKWHRNIATLVPYSARFPREQRWHYYLAEAHRALGQHVEALIRYRTCAALDGWNEEGAWAAYRGAQLLVELGRCDEAIEMCVRGMARHAGFAELPWLAGVASSRLGRHEQALYWARLARANDDSAAGPVRAVDRRVGFRDQRGLRGGPLELERSALAELGHLPVSAHFRS